MKIIPAIDVMEGKVVRLYRGDPSKKTVYSDNPLEIASKWQSAGADKEAAFAEANGIPVYHSIEELKDGIHCPSA